MRESPGSLGPKTQFLTCGWTPQKWPFLVIFQKKCHFFLKKGLKSGYFFNKISLISRSLTYMRNKQNGVSSFCSSVYILSLGFWEHDMGKWSNRAEYLVFTHIPKQKKFRKFLIFSKSKNSIPNFFGIIKFCNLGLV